MAPIHIACKIIMESSTWILPLDSHFLFNVNLLSTWNFVGLEIDMGLLAQWPNPLWSLFVFGLDSTQPKIQQQDLIQDRFEYKKISIRLSQNW